MRVKSFVKFSAVVLGILLTSAFLAPVLFDFLPYKFERIFNRLIMIGVLAAIVFFVRVSKETFRDYGLIGGRGSLRQFLISFCIGVFGLGVLTLFFMSMGHAAWAPARFTVLGWGKQICFAAGAAALIGVIEEFFFRGFVFLSLKNKFRWPMLAGVLATSVFYSLVHFVGRGEKVFIGPNPSFTDSLKLVVAAFNAFSDWRSLWPEAFGLFIFGVVLNMLLIRKGSLFPAIGFHAGCVFFVKLDGSLVDFLNNKTLFLGSSALYDGLTGWVFLILLLFLLELFVPRMEKALKNENEKAGNDAQGI